MNFPFEFKKENEKEKEKKKKRTKEKKKKRRSLNRLSMHAKESVKPNMEQKTYKNLSDGKRKEGVAVTKDLNFNLLSLFFRRIPPFDPAITCQIPFGHPAAQLTRQSQVRKEKENERVSCLNGLWLSSCSFKKSQQPSV